MRKPHYLTVNHNTELPRHLIFFDTETTGNNPVKLKLGCVCYQRYGSNKIDWAYFETNQQLWDFIFSHCYTHEKTYVFAHNLGGFDLMVVDFAKYLADNGYTCKQAIIQCPPTILKYQKVIDGKVDRTICFLDTLNYFRESLASLGKNIGKEKQKDDNFGSEYCKNDVDIIRYAMIKYLDLVRKEDLGCFAPTTPSQAFNAFRHRFMTNDIWVDDNEDALELARRGYYGGRCEAFYLGTVNNIFVLDINSMYPYVMKNNSFPTQLRDVIDNPTIKQCQNLQKDSYIIIDCLINTDENKFPLKSKNGLLFPIGEFKTTLHSPEIDWNNVTQVLKISTYKQEFIFTGYVDYWYDKKTTTQGYERNFAKKMLNSLYGKFGQSGIKTDIIGQSQPNDYKTYDEIQPDGSSRTITVFGGLVKSEYRGGESGNSHPAIAGSVTSYARNYLANLISKSGYRNCYYCDTDSLFVNSKGFKNLAPFINEKELGKLKLEKVVKSGKIRGLKDYVLDDTEKIKGIRLHSESTTRLSDNIFEQDSFRSIKGAIRDNDIHNMQISRITKTLKRENKKSIGDKEWLQPIQLKID